MTCKKTKPDRSAKSARCESVETKMIGLIGAGNTPMDGRKIKKRKRIQMNLKKKYGNYELHPQMKITGYENEIWDEKKVFEYSICYYPGNRYKYTVEL